MTQSGTCRAIAMETVLLQIPILINTDIPSICLIKDDALPTS